MTVPKTLKSGDQCRGQWACWWADSRGDEQVWYPGHKSRRTDGALFCKKRMGTVGVNDFT